MPLCVGERSVQVIPSKKLDSNDRNERKNSISITTGKILSGEGTQLDDDCCWEFMDENVEETIDLSPFQYYDNSLHEKKRDMSYPNYPRSVYQEADDSGFYEHYGRAKSFENEAPAVYTSTCNDQSAPTTTQQDSSVPDAWKAEMESLEPYPPNKIFERIDIHPVKGKGRCAFALVDFEPGEVIFVELPVLVATPSLDQALYDSLKKIHEESQLSLPPMWHLAALYSVMRLSPEKKSILLDKWVPSSRIMPSDDVIKVLHKTKLKVDPTLYERFLQVWRFNSFGHHAAPEGLVLYNYISMLSHSCNASASWHYGTNDAFTLRARQKIQKGSEISISYIGDEDLFKATHVRQEKLSGWLFVCACDRCSSPKDLSRGFRCTSCGVGTVFLKTTKEPNETVTAEATFSSQCTLCDDTPSKNDIRQYITVENAYAEKIEELNSNLLEDIEVLYAEAQRVFVQHWLLHSLNGILLEGYKKRSRFVEATDVQLKRVDYVSHACPCISYTLAWLYEELGDLYSQRWNIVMTENLGELQQHQKNTMSLIYETAMNMLIILCGSCHDYTLVAYQKYSIVSQKPNLVEEERNT